MPETAHIRDADWKMASAPYDLHKRWVEITGPVDRKMMINVLNSGADTIMADFEDSISPIWDNVLQGQINLKDAIRRTLEFKNADGKSYLLNEDIATLLVRPRGWHLDETPLLIDGGPISASLFDFGLYHFHIAHELIRRGTAPYFYLDGTWVAHPDLVPHARAIFEEQLGNRLHQKDVLREIETNHLTSTPHPFRNRRRTQPQHPGHSR